MFDLIAGPVLIVVGVLVILFRKPLARTISNTRRAIWRGSSFGEYEARTATPATEAFVGAGVIVLGIVVLLSGLRK